MASRWQKCLALSSLVFVFSLTACGDPEEPTECDPEVEDCGEGDTDDNQTLACDPDELNDEAYEQCLCDEGEEEFCPTDQGCQSDNDCTGTQGFCYEGGNGQNTCESRNFICTLLDCSGQPGVCDADTRACVNAEVCTSTDDCLADHLCIEGTCELEEDVCSVCTDDEICEYDRNTLTAECADTGVCEPGNRECSADGNSLIACNSDGTVENQVPCGQGCDSDTNRCLLAQGDACYNPFSAEDGSSFEIDWTIYTNVYEPTPETECVEGNTLLTTGADVAFEIDVADGQIALVTMDTPVNYGLLYMTEACTGEGIEACSAPSGENGEVVDDQYQRTLWYFNETGEDQTIFVVADTGPQSSAGPATIDFEVVDYICEPGTMQCSDSTIGECNSLGTAFEPLHECSLGCSTTPDDEGCQPAPNSTCEDAIDIMNEGATFTGEIVNFRLDEEFDAETCDEFVGESIGFSQPNPNFDGNTAYFDVTLGGNERLTASLASTFDAGIWLTDQCDRNDGQCVTSYNEARNTERLEYINPSADPVDLLLVVQAISPNIDYDDEFTLDITIDPPLCLNAGAVAGDVLGCFDGDRLGYCPTSSDFASFYGCTGDCLEGECVDPSGDRCLDTIPAQDGGVYSGSFADQNSTLPGSTCLDNGVNTRGGDTIYQIEVAQNQVLSAQLTSTSNSVGLYLLDDCPIATGSLADTCVANNFPAKNLDVLLEDAGTYFLVVGSTNANEDAGFDLSLSITDGICLPGETLCSTEAGSTFTTFCEANANELTTVEVCAGECNENFDACGAPTEASNQCADALAITESSILRDSFSEYTDRNNIQDGDCDTEGIELDGPDAYYEVQLDPLQGIILQLNTAASAALIVYEACGDLSACSIHSIADDGDTLEFYSPEGGTYWIAAKAASSSSADFELDFNFYDGDCVPADNTCGIDGNGDDIAERCTDLGERIVTDCEFGCTDGECLDRPGNFCATAFDIDTGEENTSFEDTASLLTYSFATNIAGFTNEYEPRDAGGDSCTGWEGKGAEVVFSFQGWNGDQITIDLDSDFDGTLWLTTDCAAAAESCVAGVDKTFGPGSETLTFDIDTTTTHYLMADAVQSGASGDLTLDVSITKGPRLLEPEIDITDTVNLVYSSSVEEVSNAVFRVTNIGELPLEFDVIFNEDWLDITPVTGTLDGAEFADLTATVTCPADPTTLQTTITIESNDAGQPSWDIPVEVECLALPGSLNVDIQGLPSGTFFNILVRRDGDSDTDFYLPQDGQVSDLIPGEYELKPAPAQDSSGIVYTAPDVSVTVESGEEATATVVYVEN